MNELLKKVGEALFKNKQSVKCVSSENEYITDLESAKEELDNAISNFSFVTDPELIDLYTYKIMAAQVKYNYHLTRAKRHIS